MVASLLLVLCGRRLCVGLVVMGLQMRRRRTEAHRGSHRRTESHRGAERRTEAHRGAQCMMEVVGLNVDVDVDVMWRWV